MRFNAYTQDNVLFANRRQKLQRSKRRSGNKTCEQPADLVTSHEEIDQTTSGKMLTSRADAGMLSLRFVLMRGSINGSAADE